MNFGNGSWTKIEQYCFVETQGLFERRPGLGAFIDDSEEKMKSRSSIESNL